MTCRRPSLTVQGLKFPLNTKGILWCAFFAQISEAETGRTVRTSDWKYCVKAPEFKPDEPYSDIYEEEYLYDLHADPHERHNLVSDPAYAKVRTEMAELLLGYMKKAKEPEAKIIPCTQTE